MFQSTISDFVRFPRLRRGNRTKNFEIQKAEQYIMIKKCLTIAGSDCSGGAGIQADLKAFSAHGVYGASVITSVVAENTSRVISVHNIPVNEIEAQIDAVFEDIEIDSVKIGMLPTVDTVKAVAAKLEQYKPKFVVFDPIMFATSGNALTENNARHAFIEYLFPLCDLVTPNLAEADEFTGGYIDDISNMEDAGRILCEYGAKAVLVKGGELEDEEDSFDVLCEGENYTTFTAKRIDSPNTHGTGCALSSAIAANVALGKPLVEAVQSAKDYVTAAIENSYTVGRGHSPVNHFYKLWK